MVRTVKKNLQEGIELAKSRWSNHFAERIHSMSYFTKDAWSAVNKLKYWIQGNHVTPNIMRFKKADDTYTKTDEEKLEVLSPHFTKVFNSNVNTDWSNLTEVKQKLNYSIMNSVLQLINWLYIELQGIIVYHRMQLKHWTRRIEIFYLKYFLKVSKIKLISKNGKLEYWKYYQKRRSFQSQQLAGY